MKLNFKKLLISFVFLTIFYLIGSCGKYGNLNPDTTSTDTEGSLLYITSQGYNLAHQSHVGSCSLTSNTGLVNGCTTSGVVPLLTSFDIDIDTSGSTKYAYIINNKNGDNPDDVNLSDIIVRCEITAANLFKNCVDSGAANQGAPTGGFSNPESITVHNGFVYVGNTASTNVSYCKINQTTHDLSDCKDATNPSYPFVTPTKVAFRLFAPLTTYAYIINSTSDTVTICKSINATTGLMSSCSDFPSLSLRTPWGIAFHTSSGTDYAYITNTGDNTVKKCEKMGDGSLAACTDAGGSFVFSTPIGITIDSANNTAYISNSGSQSIIKCDIKADANFINCTAHDGSSILSGPYGIVYYNGFTYIANVDFSTITRFDGTGSFVNSEAGLLIGSESPRGITFATINNSSFAYISNPNPPSDPNILTSGILFCKLDATTGVMTDCANSGAKGDTVPLTPYGMATYNNSYVYITTNIDDFHRVYFCKINTNGDLSTCNIASNTIGDLNGPYGIAINKEFSYITNNILNTVSKCTIVPTTGDFSDCVDSGASSTAFNGPRGIVISHNFAYIANGGNNKITICKVDLISRQLSACSTSTAGGLLSSPTGVAIKNGFLYIANLGINTTSDPAVQSAPSVTKCRITNTTATISTLSECTNTVGIIDNLKRGTFDLKFY